MPEQIGQFKILGMLGKGAMGEVYEGVDPALNRRVALKVLGAKHRESGEFKKRFLREGRSLAAMNHSNIVQVYAIGEHEGRPFLAMEFLDGEDLGDAIKLKGAIHPGDAAEIVRQSAIGLAQAQEAGVVHRDVKPSNLVLTQAGQVKVTDFGLAKALQEDLSITATGVFVGTPDYLAPEQAMGEEVDGSADIYALGCSWFHMCSGYPPFREGGKDDHYTAVVRRHLKAERPVLSKKFPGFDREISDLCRRMMSRRREVRPQFSELIELTGQISRRLGGQVPPRHQPPVTLPMQALDEELLQAEREEAPEAPAEPNRKVAMLIGLGVLLGLGVGVSVAAIMMSG